MLGRMHWLRSRRRLTARCEEGSAPAASSLTWAMLVHYPLLAVSLEVAFRATVDDCFLDVHSAAVCHAVHAQFQIPISKSRLRNCDGESCTKLSGHRKVPSVSTIEPILPNRQRTAIHKTGAITDQTYSRDTNAYVDNLH